MSMITEFVKRLRKHADTFEKSGLSVDGIVKDYRESADVIEELSAKLQSANMERSSQYYNGGWIPVSEMLPEKYTYTLWCASSGYVRSDYFNGEFWEDAKKYCYEIIAWMPLPEPYKAESEE